MTTFVNIVLVVVMFFNAISPLAAVPTISNTAQLNAANAQEPAPTETPGMPLLDETPTVEAPISLPSTPEVELTPIPTETQIELPTEAPTITPTDPEPTEMPTETPTNTPSITPTVTVSELSLSVDYDKYTPGQPLTMHWVIDGGDNISPEMGWHLSWTLPQGFQPQDPSAGTFDPQNRLLLQPVTANEGDLTLINGDQVNDVVIHVILMDGSNNQQDELTFEVKAKKGTRITKDGGIVIGLDGKVKVKFPPNALIEDADISIDHPIKSPKTLPNQGGDPIQMMAVSAETGEDLHQFNEWVEIEITYDPEQLGFHPSKLFLYYYDEAKDYWSPVPSQVDEDKQVLHAWTNHFSLFTTGSNSWESATLPSLDAAQVAPFTGSATYSIPIEVPEGPGGIKPSVSLDYNSQSVEGIGFGKQASWVGMGWSLSAGGAIMRNMGENQDWDGDDTYSLTIGGTSMQLVPVSHYPEGSALNATSIDYKATDDNFWKIRRYIIRGSGSYAAEDDYWVVWDKAGNKYTFDYLAMYGEKTSDIVLTLRPWGWFLSQTTNTVGQIIKFNYDPFRLVKCYGWDSSINSCGYSAWSDMSVYLSNIQYGFYTGSDGKQQIPYQIDFVREKRLDYNYLLEDTLQFVRFEEDKLASIQVRINGNIIREYKLTYNSSEIPNPLPSNESNILFPGSQWTPADDGIKKYSSALQSVQEYGIGGYPTGAHRPPTSFTYTKSMFLSTVNNGQGGIVTFTYDTTPWYDPIGVAKQKKTLYSSYVIIGGSSPSWALGLLDNPLPGMAYKVTCDINTDTADSQIYYAYNYKRDPSTNSELYVRSDFLDIPVGASSSDFRQITGYFVIPGNVAKTNGYITIWVVSGVAKFKNCTGSRTLTHYRVTRKALSDGLGKTFNFDYTYFDPAVNDATHSEIINHIAESNRLAEANTEFRGHYLVKEVNQDTHVRTDRYFHQTDEYKGKNYRTEIRNNDNYVLLTQSDTWHNYISQPTETDTRYCVKKSSSGACLADQKVNWVYVLQEDHRIYSSSGTVFSGWFKKYTYDQQYGNPTQITEYYNKSTNTTPQWSAYRMTSIGYQPNNDATHYLVSQPAFTNVYKCNPDGTCDTSVSNLISSTCYSYAPTGGATPTLCTIGTDGIGHAPAPLTGLVRLERKLLTFDNSVAKFADTQYNYYGYGGLASKTIYGAEGSNTALGSKPQTTVYEYDVDNTHLIKETNPFGHVTTYQYVATSNSGTLNTNGQILGLPTIITDPNGNDLYNEYDSFGRLLKRFVNTLSTPIVDIGYTDFSSSTSPYTYRITQRINSVTYMTSRKYYDGLGRVVQEQVFSVKVGSKTTLSDIVVDKVYDASGNLLQQSIPYEAATSGSTYKSPNTAIAYTKNEYDQLGRLIKTTGPDATVQNFRYDAVSWNGQIMQLSEVCDGNQPRTSGVCDSNAKWSGKIADSFGRTVKAYQAKSGTVEENPIMEYTYNGLDQLIQAKQNTTITNIDYDMGGRKISMIDPDLGSWDYKYNADGSLFEQKDAKNQYTCMYYDRDRLIEKYLPPADSACSTSAPAEDSAHLDRFVFYGYDQTSVNMQMTDTTSGSFSVANPKGNRTSVKDATGITAWSYPLDNIGSGVVTLREVNVFNPVEGTKEYLGTYKTAVNYNLADLPFRVTYPNGPELGEMVSTYYNNRMLPFQLTSSLLENGTNVIYASGALYDPMSRLTEIKLGTGLKTNYEFYQPGPNKQGLRLNWAETTTGTTSLWRLTYSYDSNGNITTLSDRYKLISGTQQDETWDYVYDSFQRLTSATMKVTDSPTTLLSQTYGFNTANGNLTSVTNNSLTTNYVYDSVHPHAVSEVDAQHAGVEYTYDTNGNMTSRYENGITYTQTWTPENRLEKVAWTDNGLNEVSFRYDGDGNRVLREVKKDGVLQSKTVYIDGIYEKEITTGVETKYYTFAGRTVAVRNGTTLSYLFTDHLGSNGMTTSADGTQIIGVSRYLPYGQRRMLSGDLKTDKTFTGQRSESFGLMDYNARYYDPSIMMFNQPDTLIPDPYNPLDWNRYLYARANPLRYTDPSGHFSEDQLREWYGKEWRKSFSEGWQALLLKAEFGDAIVYGDVTAVFALNEGSLVGWDVNARATLTLGQLSSGSGELALYRSANVNQGGGPSKFGEHGMFGEATSPADVEYNKSNYYLRIMGDPEHTSSSITLPREWYSGNDTHVNVSDHFAGFDLGPSDVFGGGVTMYAVSKAVQAAGKFSGKAALEGLGGWAGVAALAVDVASWTTWDTSYRIMSGQGPMPICPVPTP